MVIHIQRREFIALIGGAAVAWPLAARAQQPAMPVVGLLSSNAPDLLQAFRQGLKGTGYAERENMAIELSKTPETWKLADLVAL
jgi:putative tryptophan/tyrosine transport system substrate-binding protein